MPGFMVALVFIFATTTTINSRPAYILNKNMPTELIGDLIDKLTIINVKIWDATQKAHVAYQKNDQKTAHDLFAKVEMMNVQRKEYINAISAFFSDTKNQLNQKSFAKKS